MITILLIAIPIIVIVEVILRVYFQTTLLWFIIDLIQKVVAWVAIAWEVAKNILRWVLGSALEIVTIFFYASFVLVPSLVLGIDSWWIFLIKILVTLGFLVALRVWGPFERGDDPQDERFYTFACWVGMFVPPWGLYMLRRWRPFGLAVAVQWAAVMFKIGGADRIFLYGVLVLASLAVWGWGFVRKPLQRFGGGALKGIKVIIAAGAAWFVPPLGIVLIPLFFSEGDVSWSGVALQGILNAILWLGITSIPFIGWVGFVAAYGHVIWFWWNNRAK